MKKGIFASYMMGITDTESGESYRKIIRYWIPEYVTSLIIYVMPVFFDSAFIGYLKSTPTYAAVGVANGFLHFVFKIAEAFSIAAVVLIGYHNGIKDYKSAGRVLRDSFWITTVSGLLIGGSVYFGAYWIYVWMGVSPEIIGYGVPYLQVRALSFFFLCMSMAFLGFMRGIKNTRTPMYIYLSGALAFVICDYWLIFGGWGIPALGLYGSALASIIQNGIMALVSAGFIFLDPRYRPYGITLGLDFKEPGYIKNFFKIVWPVAIDKATLAAAYLWLAKMINPMGTATVAMNCAVKDLERIAFLPAIAFAQVVTFLVSNDYGAHRWHAIKSNIKKVIFLSSILVGCILVLFSIFTTQILAIFDRCGDFTQTTARIFPYLSILVLFDVLQIILSGSLRGSGNVKIVMMVRLFVIGCYFIPLSYFIAQLPIADPGLKFLCIYGSFYLGNGIMSAIYINYFRGQTWKKELPAKDT